MLLILFVVFVELVASHRVVKTSCQSGCTGKLQRCIASTTPLEECRKIGENCINNCKRTYVNDEVLDEVNDYTDLHDEW